MYQIKYTVNIINTDVSIKIIFKKAMLDKNNIKKCHVSNLIFEKSQII